MTRKKEKDCMDVIKVLDSVELHLDEAMDEINKGIINTRRKFKGLPDRFKKQIEEIQNRLLDILTDDEVLQEDIESYIHKVSARRVS